MKNKIITFIFLLLCFALILTSCGEYKPAVNNHTGTGSSGTSSGDQNPTDDDNPFTVSLSYNGELYIPNKTIEVRWNDGFSYHKAEIGADGYARVGGLDGDYQVTLSDVPDGYGYNPNAYIATNDNRNVVIEIFKLVTTQGAGNSLYQCINIRSTGVYRAEINDASTEIFYEFSPSKSGTYSVVAWVDTTENVINPQANYYGANAFFKRLQFTADDGGAESSYTKNFKLDVEIADEMISDGGQVTFTFGLKATSKNDKYPAVVYFAIMLNGEFSLNHGNATLMVPQEILVQQPEYGDEYTFVGAEISKTVNGNTANIFDGTMYKLWAKDDGGDGYYHVYDTAKYPETFGYGPILYAYISAPCRFMDTPFINIEERGNKALTVSNGTENYKLFIEGFEALLVDPPGDNGPYFCVTNCPCRVNGACPGACTDECTNCHADCRRCPEEAMGKKGYSDYCNSDGVYGVTQELKEFLQKYSISQLLYFDGNGFVETNPSISIYAGEDDQWLFACGYYVKK